MRAVILAGGKGTRLAPYTTVLPKPLMPVGEMPILEIVMRQLVNHGFDDQTLAVGYLAELLMAYCGDGSKFGATLEYSREGQPLGTAGPIALVPNLNETFLVMNGDLLTTIDYSAMLKNHRERGVLATIACYQRDVKIDLGVIDVDSDNWVANYIEKPTYHYEVSMGIYIFEPAILNYIPLNQKLDLPDLMLNLLKAGQKVNVFKFDGYWLDIGRPDDYERAIDEFAKHRQEFIKE
ncbi:sugar phosphate nucleotidyltransferase [Candidatus Villigracilis saccharophilus]|uniref:sugar phosphate nucleotidyltransferase n=1 Tax=Candidatus Villigracilis saccharophilus TaxID=3140684 RepID=UPI0031357F8C|nr:NTP transferase domain-containing protein [Anaerolineales bacterium]